MSQIGDEPIIVERLVDFFGDAEKYDFLVNPNVLLGGLVVATLAVSTFKFVTFRQGITGMFSYVAGVGALGVSFVQGVLIDIVAPFYNAILPALNLVLNVADSLLPQELPDLTPIATEVGDVMQYMLYTFGAGTLLGIAAWNGKRKVKVVNERQYISVDAEDLERTVYALERAQKDTRKLDKLKAKYIRRDGEDPDLIAQNDNKALLALPKPSRPQQLDAA